jgi:TLD
MEEKESFTDDLFKTHSASGEINISHKRAVSLSDIQAFFLHALLIDDEQQSEKFRHDGCLHVPICKKKSVISDISDVSERRLNDEMLFTIPVNPSSTEDDSKVSSRVKKRRSLLYNLWRSHEKGIHPKQLIRRAKSKVGESDAGLISKGSDLAFTTSGSDTFDSDEEVRNEKKKNDDLDTVTESSSIEDDDVVDKYNPWEVLRDEYAEDFGFSYNRKSGFGLADDSDDDNVSYNSFKILGTSADDKSIQHHVLSPPLMDALMTFLPDHLQSQNYWLRYSLVRDGANYETMKKYIHPCKFTIIAIETMKGEVFGSFTSSPWRTNLGFFGHIPAFVWKMRYNRRTKCSSLYEQAQLESMIDVHINMDKTQRMQLCRHNGFAVGGDETMPDMDEYDDSHEAFIASESSGFAIAIFDESLACGTTSQSNIFKSPSLIGAGDRTEVYSIAGLEVWTLTPAFDIASAEKLEMSKYFVEESISRASSSRNNSSRNSSNRSLDLAQDLFYRRIGDDAEGESRRENSLYNDDRSSKGFGRSPRFQRKQY